jgi:tripartite-type tricarboxylate transporter receptor subunit TctC
MKRRQFTLHTATALAAASALISPALQAQDKTLKILVGFPAGGSVDSIARLLAEKMRTALGQSVVVENKPGASARLVMAELKRAAPDGQTLVLAPSSPLVLQPWFVSALGYDPVKDFTPVARVSSNDFVVTAGPAAPAGDLKTVLAWMRANPDKANYAHSGAGSTPHFAGLMLAQASGTRLTHVPYRGGVLAATDLIGGQIPLMVDTASETIEYHKAGKARILAVTGAKRSRSLPDVPTLKEAGIDVVADAFLGIYGPAGLPAETVARIEKAVADTLRLPEVQEKIYAFGLVPDFGGSAELVATQAAHYKKWEAPVKASGFKPD